MQEQTHFEKQAKITNEEASFIGADIDKERITEHIISRLKTEERTSKLKYYFVLFLVLGEILILIGIFLFPKYKTAMEQKKNEVAIVNINKVITGKYIDKIMNEIDKAVKKENIKEFIIVMDSPGGSPTASQEFAEYLKYINKKKKVHMYVNSMAASGGYYIASAIKPIYANKNAIVGSIGVIMPHYSIEGLAKKLGVNDDYVAAGKFKKPVSLFRQIDQETREYLKSHLLLPTYKNFLIDVAKNRGIDVATLKRYAEGQIFIANDPRIRGILVDNITNLFELKNKIKEKYNGKDFKFVEISPDKKPKLFPLGTNLNIDVNIKGDQETMVKKALGNILY